MNSRLCYFIDNLILVMQGLTRSIWVPPVSYEGHFGSDWVLLFTLGVVLNCSSSLNLVRSSHFMFSFSRLREGFLRLGCCYVVMGVSESYIVIFIVFLSLSVPCLTLFGHVRSRWVMLGLSLWVSLGIRS